MKKKRQKRVDRWSRQTDCRMMKIFIITVSDKHHVMYLMSGVDWQLHQQLCCGVRRRLPLETVGRKVILFGGHSGRHTGLPSLISCLLFELRRPAFCVCVCVCVCVDVPPEQLLCPLVFTYTHSFLFIQSQRVFGLNRLTDWAPLDVPPAAPPSLCVCVCLRGSSVHDPKTEWGHGAESRHTHPDNHTELIMIMSRNRPEEPHVSLHRLCRSKWKFCEMKFKNSPHADSSHVHSYLSPFAHYQKMRTTNEHYHRCPQTIFTSLTSVFKEYTHFLKYVTAVYCWS